MEHWQEEGFFFLVFFGKILNGKRGMGGKHGEITISFSVLQVQKNNGDFFFLSSKKKTQTHNTQYTTFQVFEKYVPPPVFWSISLHHFLFFLFFSPLPCFFLMTFGKG